MKDNNFPNPNEIFPLKAGGNLTYVKPTVKNPNIVVGDFTYFADVDFESHVTHFYDFIGDKLIIGKFCQIGKNVNFVMNGANHQLNSLTTYPFYIFKGWDKNPPPLSDLPIKGDTVVGNDVWMGENVTVMPGVKIGDGAIIGMNTVVAKDVPPYTVVVGNPAKIVRKRFDDETISLLLKLKWWDMDIEKINSLIPVLTNSDLKTATDYLKTLL